MTFVIFLAVSIIVGVVAQRAKNRTGAVWGFLALIMMCLIWVLCEVAIASDAGLRANPNSEITAVFISSVLGGGVLLGIIATLPKAIAVRPVQDSAGKTRTCPFCAELIKFESKVCRYCQRDLPASPEVAEERSTPPGFPIEKRPETCSTCGGGPMEDRGANLSICVRCGARLAFTGR